MTTQPYSAREIELLFKRIDEKLDSIKISVDLKHEDTDKRIETLETDVKDLKTFQTRTITIWGVAITVFGFFLNKIF